MKWRSIRVWPSRRRLAFWLAVLTGLIAMLVYCIHMPGSSFAGEPAALDARGEQLEHALRRHVDTLANQIGPRHLDGRNQALTQARDYLRAELERSGYTVSLQSVAVGDRHGDNLEAVRPGRRAESFVVGAHYDSVALLDPRHDCPAADDNASGVAVALTLAEHFATREPERTLRFAFFVNEEPPYFWNDSMGSLQYARSLRAQEIEVVGMWSLETLGYYRDDEGSQRYPPVVRWLYPSRGNFLAFVGNLGSRDLVRDHLARFRRHAEVPSEGAAMPERVQGVGWSDHWAFWQIGVPALMLTDTAPFRNPHYHTPHDTADTLDYPTLTRVATALAAVLEEVADDHP